MVRDNEEEAPGAEPRLAPGREFDLIRTFYPRAHRPRGDVRVGAGDDCAVVAGDGIALSSDMSVEGTHFRRDWLSPTEIGYRAAPAALSDLAAVAARPIGVLVSLAMPERDAGEPARQLMDGVREAVHAVGGVLLGGDLTRTEGPLVIDVTAVGEVSTPVLRSGARVGDSLWVTGELGAPALAVAYLLEGTDPPPEVRLRFAAPTPRTAEARWLAERGVCRAMIDLSDGLAGDAAHIAASGGVRLILVEDAIPLHPSVAGLADPSEAFRLAVAGGEEYELCFAAAPGSVEQWREAFLHEFGLRLTRVGRVEAGEGVFLESITGVRPLSLAGFQHFRHQP